MTEQQKNIQKQDYYAKNFYFILSYLIAMYYIIVYKYHFVEVTVFSNYQVVDLAKLIDNY